MSLARKHRDRVLAEMTALASSGDVTSTASAVEVPFYASAQDRTATIAAAQIGARLTHDLRRLKEIKSIAHKIAAKREMLPEYADWVAGLLSGAQAAGAGVSGDVLPTVMVWRIDVGDFAGAMPLIEHVLAHKVAMPTRYARDAATLIVEEIADAAIRCQAADHPFDLAILEQVEALTADDDMHDEVRAKLLKAIGVELDRAAQAMAGTDAAPLLTRSLTAMKAAQALHDRVGVKTTIKAVEKRLAAVKPETANVDA
ncbi:phage terminase small subunit [Sphingomonas sp.]|uniref:phage terminase small subunit n=1 Tax=Sphingomonas sp. TaxID=28214 RepID=UPI000DBBF174|nr:phage terminase small subunit [Sphingomonas sp.]PZT91675.1 MAG: terminase [Sphingomonas sp.]